MTSPIIIQNAQLQSFNRREWTPADLFVGGEQGMWYDPSDLTVEKVAWRRNLLTYSENFENAVWLKTNSSILSNLVLYSQDFNTARWSTARASVTANSTIAPDGTVTAETLTEDTATGTHVLFASTALTVISGISYTLSVYAKANTRSFFYIEENSSKRTWFNLSNGTVGTTASGTTASIVSIGSGWYRCIITFTSSATVQNVGFGLASADNTFSYTGDGASNLFLWGVQLVPGSTAQTYTRSLVTAAPILFTDPFGGATAQKLVENTASSQHFMFATGGTMLTGIPNVASAYLKAGERTQASIVLDVDVSAGAAFNLTNGTIINSGSGVTASIQNAGDGWYRCIVAYSSGANGKILIQLGTRGSVYTGDGVSGILVHGSQVEQGTTVSAYQKITDFNTEFLSTFPTHTLYQESTGVTPVTTLGQSVGLVLDKRSGALTNLGPELVTNGTFTTGSGWSTGGGTWVIANGLATLTTGPAGVLSQPSTTAVVGRTYLVTFTVTNYLSGSVRVEFGGVNGVVRTTNGTYTQFITATATNFLVMQPITTTTLLALDNISIREVPGNHIAQSTIGSRPTLQARSNLLIRTEEFDNAAWGKAPAGTGVTAVVTANAGVAPDGTTTADQVVFDIGAGTTSSDWSWIAQGYTSATGVTYTLSGWVRTVSGTAKILLDTQSADSNLIDVTTTWTRFSSTRTETLGQSRTVRIGLRGNQVINGQSTSATVLLWGVQLEEQSSPSTYQRVVTATDYADVGVPRGLQFDGVDDWMATSASVDFSKTDKVTLVSGVTKLSDAARGVFAHLGNRATSTFRAEAPISTLVGFGWFSSGTAPVSGVAALVPQAPTTQIYTGIGNIIAKLRALRLNAVQVVFDAVSDQGTGNFANDIFYVGRRGDNVLFFNGRLHQLLINGRQFSGDEITRTEQWMASRTGVTL